MATILIIEDKLSLKCTYEERFRAKEVPGARWDPNMKVWQYPSDEVTIRQLMAAFPQAKVSGDVQAFLARKAEIRQRLIESKEVLWHTDAPLRDYQKAGVNFLIQAKRAILGDDPGLGKTLQAIMACEGEQARRALIVCPNTIKWVWYEEIKKWTGKEAVVIGGPRKKSVRKRWKPTKKTGI
jgi:SNF2 family DNA or RNA helicase